ncbi:MAG TPA: TlpA disulfide reductase family protein [Pyrinomonadaceae bacterium]|nr:TlpA disulfide reductase family protein [Pyrinomonadaceae bacterium]
MKKIILLSLLVLILRSSAPAQSGRRIVNPPPPREPVVESAPVESPSERLTPITELSVLPDDIANRELRSIDEGTFRLADFRGKVVVVNIWATWCGPCRREVPDYEKVRKEFAGKAVEFIGLTTEDPRTASEKVKKFARDFNFGFRLGWADRETAQMLMNGRRAIPQTLVIAADGRIVSHWNGYGSQSRSRLRDTIDHALSEK